MAVCLNQKQQQKTNFRVVKNVLQQIFIARYTSKTLWYNLVLFSKLNLTGLYNQNEVYT